MTAVLDKVIAEQTEFDLSHFDRVLPLLRELRKLGINITAYTSRPDCSIGTKIVENQKIFRLWLNQGSTLEIIDSKVTDSKNIDVLLRLNESPIEVMSFIKFDQKRDWWYHSPKQYCLNSLNHTSVRKHQNKRSHLYTAEESVFYIHLGYVNRIPFLRIFNYEIPSIEFLIDKVYGTTSDKIINNFVFVPATDSELNEIARASKKLENSFKKDLQILESWNTDRDFQLHDPVYGTVRGNGYRSIRILRYKLGLSPYVIGDKIPRKSIPLSTLRNYVDRNYPSLDLAIKKAMIVSSANQYKLFVKGSVSNSTSYHSISLDLPEWHQAFELELVNPSKILVNPLAE